MATLRVKKNGSSTWINLPEPHELTWDIYDVDSDETGRNQEGTMFRDRVAVKRKISCVFPPMRGADMHTLLSAVTDQFFTLEYPDALDGTTRQSTCYVGDRSAPIYIKDGTSWIWQSLSMNFIEA